MAAEHVHSECCFQVKNIKHTIGSVVSMMQYYLNSHNRMLWSIACSMQVNQVKC